jgi:hypothetical protein
VRAVCFLAAITIAWFYYWTVSPEGERAVLSHDGNGYYNLLTSGFLKGQTALNREVDQAMLAVKDPYDPGQRAGQGMHDASYYKGRYFIYFGVTPAVALFAPVKLLTGMFIGERFAVCGFAIAGFWISAALLLSIRRRHFQRARGWVAVTGVLALGLATMVPPLLRRPDIWEVPIAASYACFMLTLFCVWRSLSARRAGWVWLGLASLAMGLAVGARPTYLLAAVVLLAPLARRAKQWRLAEWRWLAAWALGPVMMAGAGLAAYNFVRFGSITEFGQTYQMAGDDLRGLKLFGLGYVAYNFKVYVLSVAGLSPFFPFITVIVPPVSPPGQLGVEDPYGLLPCLPWVVLGAVALGATLRTGATGALRWFVWGTLAAVMAAMGMVFGFAGACGRYMVDFTPGLVLLGGVGALWLMTRVRGGWRWPAVVLVGGLALWSAGFGLLASLQHNALLLAEHPAVYRKVAQVVNVPSHVYDRWAGVEYGPVELRVVFPRGVVGKVEPLVVTGRTFRSDFLYVHYLGDNLVRFGYEHTSGGGMAGAVMTITPGAVQTILVEMGSLYPPMAHPYYAEMPPAQARLRQRTIRVTLNGKVALFRSAELFDAVARQPDIGSARGRSGFPNPFSGQILSQRRVPQAAPVVTANDYGPVRLRLMWPSFVARRSEPLVSSGEAGRGDVVYVKYLDERTVIFGYDHWGVGGFESAAVVIDPASEAELEIDYGALYERAEVKRARVKVRLNGRIVLDQPGEFYPCPPDTVVVGANLIGASTAAAVFSGQLLKSERGAGAAGGVLRQR